MTDVKHTPGPWRAERHVTWWVTSDYGEICEIMPWSNECDKQDAHLIAAAPDMYEALRKLEYWFDTDQEILDAMSADSRRDHLEKLEMIRAAIAKAEGRDQ